MSGPDAIEALRRARTAAALAADVGRRLLAIRASGRVRDPERLGDVADHAADGYLQGALRAHFPDDGLLSEETHDAPERLARAFTWIVDPLDGTKEYQQGRDDFAVHVAAVHAGVPVAGALGLPAIDRVVVAPAADGAVGVLGAGGAWPRAVTRGDGPAGARVRIAVSRSHTPSLVKGLARALGDAELVPCGSVGFKVALLLFGRADLYVHQRGLNEWDTCAPELVARAAGWTVCRLDGSPHRYNRPDARNDEIVVCRPAMLPALLPLLASLR
jgi:3'(2'), 5'-bisphosphate nucleotidase